jgi:phage gpG-like protein
MARRVKLVHIDLDWDPSKMRDEVTDMDDRSNKFRPVFIRMREYFERHWSENFLANGLAVGGWRPLDAEYAAWKSTHIPGAPPMIRSGSLFNSIRSLRGAPNEIRRDSATFGTNIKYAKFHQYGTTKMPKREFIYEPVNFRRDWGDRIANYIKDGNV